MTPQTTDTSERGFQKLIVAELLGRQRYHAETTTADFDAEFCLNKKHLLEFIENTQPEEHAHIERKGLRRFLVYLDKKIKEHGIVHILRKGISFLDQEIELFYPLPNSTYNIDDGEKYAANIFTVTQELRYSADEKNRNRLDLTVFLNGLPLLTVELKNAYTYQSVEQAKKQYKRDRDPADKIFSFGRCMAHFAVDTSEVYFTTKLEKGKTKFFPFNKGLNDGESREPFGKGNPLNPDGLKTAYFYEKILSKECLSKLIQKFVTIVEEKDPDSGKKYKVQYFPRYHQFNVVQRLLRDCKINGVGKQYLIQHSAGSGKSNSITWLAHQLISLYDEKGELSLFDSVLVVTDRTNLDEQIRKNIKNFAHIPRIMEAITGKAKDIKRLDPHEESTSKTTHMQLALANNKKIITCTVQTFPHVLKAIQNLSLKKVAIIIDEAHSSQSGSAAASMNAIFSDLNFEDLPKDEDGNVSTEDLLNYLVESKKMLPNASYFAFTATPKNKTLETFGIPEEYINEHGEKKNRFLPFHNYSMKQAIEEEFILDVLKNYTTYKSWYKIKKDAEVHGEKEYETEEANKKIRSFVEGHEMAIKDKAKIMIEHFRGKVHYKINRQAKAMVVCRSIESAMKYKDAFDSYLKEINLPYKAIVAYSGKKKHYKTKEELTEEKMNNFPDGNNDIPAQFKKQEYRFLIVANKYQTGYDEPLLHTMYVDKQLSDVQAVQTLSRLNRAKKGKKETFVLDFYNSMEEIKEAFKPYYTTTILSEETDVNKLNELQEKLDDYQLYDEIIVEEVFRKFWANVKREEFDPLINQVANDFQEELTKDQQIDFKSKAKSFFRTYNYLVKITDTKKYWEQLGVFFKYLIPALKIEEEKDEENILEDIDMDSYRTSLQEEKQNIDLVAEPGYVAPIPVEDGGGGKDKQFDTLENIVNAFNERMGSIFSKEEKEILTDRVPSMIRESDDSQFIYNSDKANAKIAADESVKKAMSELMRTHTGIFKKFMQDDTFRKRYEDFVFDILWNERRQLDA